jgi:hypothetical protein
MPRPIPVPAIAFSFWAVFVVVTLWAWPHGVAVDTDSQMRLAQVRDLLHGQSWFDTTQWRMNIPFGLPMHWSRLVDAPIALLILMGGETFALAAWPLLLLLAAFLLLARLAQKLGGAKAVPATLLLALLAVQLWDLFAPGSIDHHNLQLVLMLGALTALVEQRPIAAALTLALGLGVGIESLPYALAGGALAALWLRDEPIKARRFGIALATAAAVLLFATTASAYRFTPACDTYSLFYAVLLAAGGAGLAAIAMLPRHRPAAFAGLILLLLAIAALVNPACFKGPYGAMDPRLAAIFLARINEARPAWDFAVFAPSEFFSGYGYALVGFACCWFAPESRARNLLLVLAGTGLLVATFEIRAVPFAVLFALPGIGAAATRLKPVPLTLALLLGNEAAFAVAGAALEGRDHLNARVAVHARQLACLTPAAMAPLARLPPGRVAAFDDQGPAVLAYTNDGVLSGPYHRNAAGLLDNDAIFAGPDPRAVLRRRGISYLMTCAATPDWEFYAARGGLVAWLAAHQVPAWLTPLGSKGNVTLYRVD